MEAQSKKPSKKKTSKKGKKSKKSKHKDSSSESDEGITIWAFSDGHSRTAHVPNMEPVFFLPEPKALHVVSSLIEMPEGASLSDNEEKDKNDIDDPHRALDIDLDS